MFLLSDVEALAALAHTDFREHLEKRERSRQERKKKLKETAGKKDKLAATGMTVHPVTEAPVPANTALVGTDGLLSTSTSPGDTSASQIDYGLELSSFIELDEMDEVIVIDD